jgi:hypothetical protein
MEPIHLGFAFQSQAFLLAFIFPMDLQVVLNLLGFSPAGRCAKNVKGRQLLAFMEKINYRKQELDLVDRLLRIIESGAASRPASRHTERVTQYATREQLRILSEQGIRPLWNATEQEAEELIGNYKAILKSFNRIP